MILFAFHCFWVTLLPMNSAAAETIARKNKESYDDIAKEFSTSRARFWDELAFLGEHATPEMRVLDIGCGNGRFYDVLKEREVIYTGVDSSVGLLEEARARHEGVEFVEGDATALPFKDKSFDIAYAFAVIHHIPSRTLRRQFVREAARVLHSGNTFIITAWDLWRPRYLSMLLFSALRSMLWLTPLDVGDMMHTFGKEKRSRYLHAFTERGLRRLLNKNGFEVVGSEKTSRKSGSGERNILIVARKR